MMFITFSLFLKITAHKDSLREVTGLPPVLYATPQDFVKAVMVVERLKV